MIDAWATLAPYYYQRCLMDPRYHCIDRLLDRHIELDDVDKIPDLLSLADSFDYDDAGAWLQDFWL